MNLVVAQNKCARFLMISRYAREVHIYRETIIKFTYTSSQPSEGWTPVGFEPLVKPDLWGSFAKHFSIFDRLTGTKRKLRAHQLAVCIVINLSKQPADGILVSVPASGNMAID